MSKNYPKVTMIDHVSNLLIEDARFCAAAHEHAMEHIHEINPNWNFPSEEDSSFVTTQIEESVEYALYWSCYNEYMMSIVNLASGAWRTMKEPLN